MDPVAPASTMAASTGPAHGTNSTPRARPRPNPLRPSLALNWGMRANGFSRICSNCGTIRPIPIRVRATMPAHRIASCGRCSSVRSADPARVTMLKLRTSPAITRYGRSVSVIGGLSLTAVAVLAPSDAAAGGRRAAGLRAGKEDHRQNRQDARRDAGDQATEEADQRKSEHVRYSLPTERRTGGAGSAAVGEHQHRLVAIQIRKQPLEIVHLGHVVYRDVRIRRVRVQEVLVVVLGGEELRLR